jgi:CO/xanthine dehydrogenase Mo-binding subunit
MGPVGQNLPRPDGLPKVAGLARYADDFTLPGMWFGATVRSPHAHARIEAVRFRPERAPAGAVYLTAADLPGPNGVQLIDDSWPILADGVVRHVGEPVALVAAPTRLEALAAREAVEVEYAPLEPVLTLEAAAALPPIASLTLGGGDVEAALARADRIVEGAYATGHQEHLYIECQAMTAWFEDDGTLVVEGSTQCPYYVHKSLVHGFELPEERVRVKASAVGGGFGGKEDFPSVIALHAALLARAAGRPVRLAYDRHEDIVGTTKRHPARIRHRTGVARDGTLLAMDVDVVLDGGAYATLSLVVLSRALLHATGPYRCPHVRISGRVLRTHTAPNSAFRGFGAPQTQFAAERQMDRIARALALDPFEVRERNVLEPGDRLPTGQLLDASTSARLCLERAEARADFRRRWRELEEARRERRDGEPRRGIGLALFFHGAGFTGNGERRMRSPVTVRLSPDGRIELLTAMIEMGQGTATVFPQIAAEAAGVALDDVVFVDPDTARVPNSGPTVASRTTMIVGGTLARAAAELAGRVRSWWSQVGQGAGAPSFREQARRYLAEVGPLEVTLRHEPAAGQSFDEATYQGAAYPAYGWGCDVAEVEVDPDTYAVRPLRVTAVCEVGRAIHPGLCAGQVEGGTLQAVGWALLEEVKMEGGRYLNDRLATYLIPTAKDSPEIDVELLERPWAGDPFGAKGMGELPMDGGAPAVAQAIENATGLLVTEIPATPERLLEAERSGCLVEPPATAAPDGRASSAATTGAVDLLQQRAAVAAARRGER